MKVFAFVLSVLLISTTALAETKYRGMQLATAESAENIQVLGSWNANVVRYPLSWADFELSDAATRETYFAWLETALDHLDSLIPTFRDQGINIILNLYTPPGGFARRDAQATHRVFTEAWAQDAFVEAWQLIANRYKNESIILAYDLLNEPAQFSAPPAPLKDWNKLALAAANAIRAIDASRMIYMTPRYGGIKFLKSVAVLPLSNIGYTIHFYDPFKFLHQGLDRYKLGVKYPNKNQDKAYLKKQLEPVIKFAKKNKVRMYIGEFTAIRWAPNESGFKYLKDILSIFEKQGWDWTYHAFREASPWDVEQGSNINDSSRQTTTNRKALMLKYFAKNP